MRVVHINVRLGEGGAAIVALDLHNRSITVGIESLFFYGYSAGAKRSIYESSVAGAVHLASRPGVMINYVTHKFSGLELFPPVGDKAERLRQAIRSADVVHLHAVHSYFLPFGWLSDLLMDAKRIVWTCHDFWPITGRCGFLEQCVGWKTGCGSCLSGSNYPPSFLDFSAYSFKKKREQISRHMDRIVFVAPSQFVCNQFKEALPLARVETVYNGIDAELESAVLSTQGKVMATSDALTTKVLVMANDLADPTKVDRAIINEVLLIEGVELHTIGRNSPFNQGAVINHDEIRQRLELVEIMRNMHALLFTSKKDTFGLVMIEAMVCGVPILALPSDAANEVLGLIGQRSLERGQIVQMLSSPTRCEVLLKLRNQLSESALKQFSGDKMFKQYLKIYN